MQFGFSVGLEQAEDFKRKSSRDSLLIKSGMLT